MRHILPRLRPASAPSRAAALGLVVLAAAGSALAQYKVVGPDGRVTYTDRPPSDANAKVTPIGRAAPPPAAGPDAALPAELRTAMQRHPVTLYTSDGCTPCDTGRTLLRARGVPFAERRVSTEEDAAALERLLGARTVPGLSIGAQPLRGFNELDWTAYLDAAGYPRENRLPRNWPQPAPRPLVESTVPAATAGVAAPAAPPADAPAAPPPDAIRF